MVIYGWKTYVQVLVVLHIWSYCTWCSQRGNNAEHVLRKLMPPGQPYPPGATRLRRPALPPGYGPR